MWHRLSEKLLGPAIAVDPRLRKRFLAYHRRDQISNSRVASVLVMVLMPAGSLLDWFVYPEHFEEFFYLRIFSSFLAAVCFGLLWLPRFSRRYYRFLSFTWFFIPTAFISLMILFSEGSASPYYAGLNLVLITVCWVAQVTFWESMVAFTTTLILYLGACFGHSGFHDSLFFNNMYFIVLTGMTMVTGNFILNRLRYREYTNRSLLDHSRHELESKNRQLLELDEAKSRFFANISHELRTPLTLILAPLEQLAESTQDPRTSDTLETMRNNAFRLLKLINDLLELARFDAGRQSLHPEKMDAAGTLAGLVQSVSAYAETRNIRIATSIPYDPVYILADLSQFEKATLNLIFNAIKFTPEQERVEITLSVSEDAVCVSVKDNGPGLAASDHARIFDPFWQADDDSTRKNQGAGLGLALVRQILESHGGRVSLNSQPGHGAEFSLHWPLPTPEDLNTSIARLTPRTSEPASEYDDPLSIAALHRRAEFFPLQQSSPHRNGGNSSPSTSPAVLVADDEPEMRHYLVNQLSRDFRVLEAADGKAALKCALRDLPALILLDYMMPELDGLEVCRQLRAHPQTALIPVILLTARADEPTRLAVLEAGATDFLTKPFGVTELLNRCRNLVGLRNAQLTVETQREKLEQALKQIQETEAELVQTAKMASLGQLSAGLLHEVNNPITFSLSAVRALEKLPPEERIGPDFQDILSDLRTGLQRAGRILTGLKRFAHPGKTNRHPVSVAELIRDASLFVQRSLQDSNIELITEIPEAIQIQGDRGQLEHVVLNCLQNSIDSLNEKATSPPKDWSPQIHIRWKDAGDTVALEIEDNGTGITEHDLPNVLNPFFTTKDVGKGLGLGLSIAYRIARNHDGTISIHSDPGRNCVFSVEFPAKLCNLKESYVQTV